MTSAGPRVLVTNDDGIHAASLECLAREAGRVLGPVTVIAPDRERSGVAHGLTIRQPLRAMRVGPASWAVEGTPTDCVNLAFLGLLDAPPQLVLSGINGGYNLGEDLTYSGTVAAAMEGRLFGVPSVAVSCASGVGREVLERAAAIACRLARAMLEMETPADLFLNVNVPAEPRGLRITRQGRRRCRQGLIRRKDPKGEEIFWLTLAGARWEDDERADHHAVAEGLVSVTPLHADLTFRGAYESLVPWESEREILG
ncbi:MAG: 5'/3'-nucleotidase SurE [Acidobacteriota bacterium]|nr:5'/3'-nucleotidase SurE [Acidobacteriota bacterium]MDQ7086736.1 5'/3'-nucleotidase SurE [Acidobacteriota bacterium]